MRQKEGSIDVQQADGEVPATLSRALLVVSFGGPEAHDEVRPFLEIVTRGRGVPEARLEQVASQYDRFGGRSPINDQVRALLTALRAELDRRGAADVGLYWGNRNWHPFLGEAVGEMARAGVGHAVAFVTSAYSSYSGCRQYLEDIERARAAVDGPAPEIDKLRVYFDHPGFIEPMVDRVRHAAVQLAGAYDAAGSVGGAEGALAPRPVRILFTAHSIPLSMARSCAYESQLHAAAALVAERIGRTLPPAGRLAGWELVWQSRSGPPQVPWLEPDVGARLRELARDEPGAAVVVAPIGFVSDHMEVAYDLDAVALPLARELGLRAVRAATVGTDPRFVAMVVDLVEERFAALGGATPPRPALSTLGVWPDRCRPGCCPPAPRVG